MVHGLGHFIPKPALRLVGWPLLQTAHATPASLSLQHERSLAAIGLGLGHPSAAYPIPNPQTEAEAGHTQRSHGAVPLPRAPRAPRRLCRRRSQEAPRSQPRLPGQIILRRTAGSHRGLRRVAAPAQAGHLHLARGRRGGEEGVQDEDAQGSFLLARSWFLRVIGLFGAFAFADSCLVRFVCVVKASAKRFRVTGRGKIVRRCAGKQHLLAKKNTKRKKRLSKMVFFCSSTLVQLNFNSVAYFFLQIKAGASP